MFSPLFALIRRLYTRLIFFSAEPREKEKGLKGLCSLAPARVAWQATRGRSFSGKIGFFLALFLFLGMGALVGQTAQRESRLTDSQLFIDRRSTDANFPKTGLDVLFSDRKFFLGYPAQSSGPSLVLTGQEQDKDLLKFTWNMSPVLTFRSMFDGQFGSANKITVAGSSGALLAVDGRGYVGVGTTTPAGSLHVVGDMYVNGQLFALPKISDRVSNQDLAMQFVFTTPNLRIDTMVVPSDISGTLETSSGASFFFNYPGTAAGVVQEFNYTGAIQLYTVPAYGSYTLEVLGAQGGTDTFGGGLGGYAAGTFTLNTGDVLYIGVGGQGGSGTGGFNGGGYGHSSGSGGGASHIATANGVLSSLSGNQGAVLIVGGGGGGGGDGSSGGGGGGLTGVNSSGGGGTQSAGGSGGGTASGFGQGGSNNPNNDGGGGGGGWYGGGASNFDNGGGGGSGYVRAGAVGTNFVSSLRVGHGFVRITYTALRKDFVIDHPVDTRRYLVHAALEGPENGVRYRGEVRLEQGKAQVVLPDYVSKLADLATGTVYVYAPDTGEALRVAGGKKWLRRGGKFEIHSENRDSDARVFWIVQFARKDIPPLEVEPRKSGMKVDGFGPYRTIKKDTSR